MDNCGLWSTFTLPTLILPLYSFDNSSMTGPIARQGPHHSAQKSTTVNLSEEITFSWKLVSVSSNAIMRVLCFVEYFCFLNPDTNLVFVFRIFGHLCDNGCKILARWPPNLHVEEPSAYLTVSGLNSDYIHFQLGLILQKSGHFVIHFEPPTARTIQANPVIVFGL